MSMSKSRCVLIFRPSKWYRQVIELENERGDLYWVKDKKLSLFNVTHVQWRTQILIDDISFHMSDCHEGVIRGAGSSSAIGLGRVWSLISWQSCTSCGIFPNGKARVHLAACSCLVGAVGGEVCQPKVTYEPAFPKLEPRFCFLTSAPEARFLPVCVCVWVQEKSSRLQGACAESSTKLCDSKKPQ